MSTPSRADKASSVTPFEPSVIQRVAGALRLAITGKAPDWFGPREPLAPVAQDAAEGRQFDYPTGYNISARPRSGEAVSFEQLRSLADNCNLVTLAIETRKDQMAKLPWTVRKVGGDDADDDPIASGIRDVLRYPDLEHDFLGWQRMLIDDMLVIDAPTVYVRKTLGGKLYALEPIDGATIKRVLSPDGRTPMPPAPAYQQFLKGMPAVDYARDELLYVPRNPRTGKVYGFSPVEQIVLTVNIAIRRAVHQLAYYTEGTVPEALASTPTTWTTDQISKFQTYFDALLEGNSAQKRKIRFIPDGTKYIPTKTEKIFDEGDEWLARVVCYAFSLPPNAFVKQVNRATSQNAHEVALTEGLFPLMLWWKAFMDRIIQQVMGQAEYEFAWLDEKDVDPLIDAQVNEIYVRAGVMTPDEVRDDLGLPPLSAQQKAEFQAAQAAKAPAFGQPGGEPGTDAKPPKGKQPPADDQSDDSSSQKATRSAALLGLHGAAAQKSARRSRSRY